VQDNQALKENRQGDDGDAHKNVSDNAASGQPFHNDLHLFYE
jgi:hypothetical protein